MFSLADLDSAWMRVRENDGCAGVDGITVLRFAERASKRLQLLRESIAQGRYRPLPLLRILIRKAPDSTKLRRLLVPCVADRIVQTTVARALAPTLEDEFLDSSFAYRPGRGVDSAIARLLQFRDRGYCSVVEADIVTYFDQVDHSLLRQRLAIEPIEAGLHVLIDAWLRTEIWDGIRLRPLRRGVPQGSPLSPILANFFLHDLDVELSHGDFHVVRYADDFVILCAGEPEARKALLSVEAWLTANKLRLHPGKTRLTSFKEGFRFLGVRFTDDEALIPWKAHRQQGDIVSVARPMPAALLSRYNRPRSESSMSLALRSLPATVLARPPQERRSSVAFLYLTQQGAVLRKSGSRFLIEKDSQILLDIPYHKLEAVLVFGNVQVTSPALGELMDRSIPVSFLTRQGRFRGSISTPSGRDIPLRIAQFSACANPDASMQKAAALISAKIQNAGETLASYGHTETNPFLDRAAQASASSALEPLLGIEGSAARIYFDSVMAHNKSDFTWPGRMKFPARDPLNALLSLAYTLLMTETAGLLEAHGLDPFLGFLHRPDYGRVSLALDLIEPFRAPVADRFVLTLVNRRLVRLEDFAVTGASDEGPLHLLPEALGMFLARWERWIMAAPAPRNGAPAAKPFRRELRRQVETLCRHWHGECDWQPWIWDHCQTAGEDACDSLSVTT